MARHRRGQPHLRLRCLGPQDRSTACVWSGQSGQFHAAAYTAKVRVSVRAGDIIIVREGSGTGEGRAPTPGQAHELALKGAETDATKRALATFGNRFGLALYDREQAGVRKTRGASPLRRRNFADWPLGTAVKHRQTCLKPRRRKVLRRSSQAGHERD